MNRNVFFIFFEVGAMKSVLYKMFIIVSVISSMTYGYDAPFCNEQGDQVDVYELNAEQGGCYSTDARFSIASPFGVPVDQGYTIYIQGYVNMAPQNQVHLVTACFFDAEGDLLGDVWQTHTVIIDPLQNYIITGEIPSLDFGDYYYASSMKILVLTSFGGIPPLRTWTSDNVLSAHFSGPIIPTLSASGIAIIIIVLSLLILFCRWEISKS